MNPLLFVLVILSFGFHATADVSWGDEIGLQRKDPRIFPAQTESLSDAEKERVRVCVELTPTAGSESACLGVPIEKFSAVRHGVCITYARSNSTYLVCMNNDKISNAEVAKCWDQSTIEVVQLGCLIQTPELETEQEIFDEIIRRFPDIKLEPPVSAPLDYEIDEAGPWSEA